jgi:archaellum biogenesis ATPase FlaH
MPETSGINVMHEFLEVKKGAIAHKLSSALLGTNESAIQELLEAYSNFSYEEEEEDNTVHVGTSITDVLSAFSSDELIKVYPKSLNEKLGGGVPPQTHILVFAPPEVGKSLFSINMACGFLSQGKKVLYWGNEDPDKAMLLRFFTRLSGMDKFDITKDPQKAEELAYRRGYGNLIFKSSDGGTIHQIEEALKEYEPDILVVDQIGNLDMKGREGAIGLEYAAKSMRFLIKKYDVVGVSVHQGSADAQGKMYLDLGDVYFSNVGVQAAMDVMIGLGATGEMLEANERMASLPKNKISGDHSPFGFSINPLLSKVVDHA